jgi:protein TonB
MGHTLVHASRFAQSGQLAERPSPARIAAYACVIALHVAAFALLMLPMAAPEATKAEETVIDFQVLKKRDPEIVPVTPPPPIQHPVRVTTHTVAPITPVPPVVTEDSTPMSQEFIETPPAEEVVQVQPGIDTSPITDAQLVYASAPPPAYPKEEERRRIQGTVMLRVLVDVDGKPIEVSVQSSSGNRRLDEVARKQVLQRWTFKPATRGGVPVQAIGLIPIAFTVR